MESKLKKTRPMVFAISMPPNGKIILKADNGNYLTCIWRSNIDGIEAAKEIADVFCELAEIADVFTVEGNKLVLKAGNGKYLSRIHRSGIGGIKAAKGEIEPYCKFDFAVQSAVLALKVYNGKYLSRISRSEIDGIEAEKGSVDIYCQFYLQRQSDRKVILKGDNGKHVGHIYRYGTIQ